MVNSNRENKRILLVEDHEDAREMVAYGLEKYTLVCACGFDEGQRLARQGYFDLYILDNWLPDGNGVELCRVIREFDPHTPILFYSACAYTHDLQAAFNAGAQKYLTKPVKFHELNMAVAQLISTARETAFEARRAEIAAIREELAVRRMENAELLEKAKLRPAEKRALRNKAQIAFLAAGGTRGGFAREWPSIFLGEARNACTSTAVGGD
jgi:DNA-binding response OmpR family regulator